MFERAKDLLGRPGLRRRLVIGGLALLGIWFVFFDSHSLVKRIQYVNERAQLSEDVQRLRTANEELEAKVEAGLTDDVVERVAREQYGMRRNGETVYPVEEL